MRRREGNKKCKKNNCVHPPFFLQVRNIVIPAAEGYGAGGFPAWGIPAGATLNFEIEVLKIN